MRTASAAKIVPLCPKLPKGRAQRLLEGREDWGEIGVMDWRVEIIAHRGSAHLAPENTLGAFELGWQETTTCELDVRLTADGRLVVIHDDTTKRTAGSDLKVAEHTLSDLQRLDAGSSKAEKWRGEKLPSLEEVIAAMPEDKKLLIEIKVGPEIMPELVRAVRASRKEKQLIFQSFFPWVCTEVKKEFPQLPVYLLIACNQDAQTEAWAPTIYQAIMDTRKNGLDGISANNTPVIDAAAVQAVHAAGLILNVWTVDQFDTARRLLALGVDGIITNRPGWLRSQLGQAA